MESNKNNWSSELSFYAKYQGIDEDDTNQAIFLVALEKGVVQRRLFEPLMIQGMNPKMDALFKIEIKTKPGCIATTMYPSKDELEEGWFEDEGFFNPDAMQKYKRFFTAE